jgi:O-succinylbenzoic acid--CoA ligase
LEPARLPGGAARVEGAPHSAPVVIAEREPAAFMAAFARASAGRGPVFLLDPEWRAAERAQAEAILAQVADAPADAADGEGRAVPAERGWLMIPSGGTGGRLKFARHDQDTIAAAVEGFRRHFEVGAVEAVGVLPLYHVSGFMAWMRCALTGGGYVPWSWADLAAGRWPRLGPAPALRRDDSAGAVAGGQDRSLRPAAVAAGGGRFISLVPTQLQRLLTASAGVDHLRSFSAILIGGGPIWPELTDAAARLGLPLALGYGMTETAAMVASQRPGEFLAGRRDCGRALPHARIHLTGDGRIRIAGASVCRGYCPGGIASTESGAGDFVTGDLGELDAEGHLRVLGRSDAVIITGGKKVDPLEVETVLRATGEFDDLAVIGLPDAEWGSAVTACFPAAGRPAPDPARLAAALTGLAPYKRPKHFCPIAPWPRNAQGKVNRVELVRLAGVKP